MNLFLFEPIPLRTTRVLGDFAEDAVLPHRYGDLSAARFPLIRLSDTRFFVADHPMEVTRVFTDGEETQSWEASLEHDEDGHTWTVVTLGAPAPTDTIVTACGLGKRNPDTGALLENPGEILQNVFGLGNRTDDWGQLRAEAAATGLTAAGSVTSADSFRTVADALTLSVGAIWSPGMSRLYPSSTVAGQVIGLSKLEASDLTVSASTVDTADTLRLGYDVSDATGKAQHFIELTASPARFGGVVREMTVQWLRQPANAEQVGTRYLEYFAGERYAVQFTASRTDIRPGTWVRLIAHPEWPFDGDDPVIMVLAATVTEASRSSLITGAYLRSVPLVTVTSHSVALPDTSEGAVEVSTSNGVTTMVLTDKDGRPLAGARVSVDGSAAQTTNAAGQVVFVLPSGAHTLAVEATGMTPFAMQIIT